MTYPKTSSAFFLFALTSSWSSGTCIVFLRGSPYTRDAGGGATSLIQPATSATSSTDWVVSFFSTVTPASLVRLCTFSSPTCRPLGGAAASSFRFRKDGAPLKEDLSRKARSLLRSCSPLGWQTQINDKLREKMFGHWLGYQFFFFVKLQIFFTVGRCNLYSFYLVRKWLDQSAFWKNKEEEL